MTMKRSKKKRRQNAVSLAAQRGSVTRRTRQRVESLESVCPCHSCESMPLFERQGLPSALEYYVYSFLDTTMLTRLHCCSKGVQRGLHYYVGHLHHQHHHYEGRLPRWICRSRHPTPKITHLSVDGLDSDDDDDDDDDVDWCVRMRNRGHGRVRAEEDVRILASIIRDNAQCLTSLDLCRLSRMDTLFTLLFPRPYLAQAALWLPTLETLKLHWSDHHFDVESSFDWNRWPFIVKQCLRLSTLYVCRLVDVGNKPLPLLQSLSLTRLEEQSEWRYFEKAVKRGVFTEALTHLSLMLHLTDDDDDLDSPRDALTFLRSFANLCNRLPLLTKLELLVDVSELNCECGDTHEHEPLDCCLYSFDSTDEEEEEGIESGPHQRYPWVLPKLTHLDFWFMWCCKRPIIPPTIVAPQLVSIDFHGTQVLESWISDHVFGPSRRYPFLERFQAAFAKGSSSVLPLEPAPSRQRDPFDPLGLSCSKVTDLKISVSLNASLLGLRIQSLQHLALQVWLDINNGATELNDTDFTNCIVHYLEPFAATLETFKCRTVWVHHRQNEWKWDRRDEHPRLSTTILAMTKLHTMSINEATTRMDNEWTEEKFSPRAQAGNTDTPCKRVRLDLLTKRLTFPRLVTFGAMLSAKAESLQCLTDKHFPMISRAFLSMDNEDDRPEGALDESALCPRPLGRLVGLVASPSPPPLLLRCRELHLFMDRDGHWLRLLSWVGSTSVGSSTLHTLGLSRSDCEPTVGWDKLTTIVLARISDVVGRDLRQLYLSLTLWPEDWPLIVELTTTERFFPRLSHLYVERDPAERKTRVAREALLRKANNPHLTIHFSE